MGQPGFFDLDERYEQLSEAGDPLVKLGDLIDFEIFRPQLTTTLDEANGSFGSQLGGSNRTWVWAPRVT
jgi:hypothetical protein